MRAVSRRWRAVLCAASYAAAGVFGAGVFWASAETALTLACIKRGAYLSASLVSVLSGRIIFYTVVSAALGCVFAAAVAAWRRRRRASAVGLGRVVALLFLMSVSVNAAFFGSYRLYKAIAMSFWGRAAIFGLIILLAWGAAAAFFYGGRRPGGRKRAVARASSFAGRLVLGAAVAWGAGIFVYRYLRSEGRPVPRGKPDVVFITLDAWRADCFTPDITPNLYSFARDRRLVFTGARAAATWTLPSFTATFTGAYGTADEMGLEYPDERYVTWPEVLWRAGYDTFALVKNPYLDTNRYLLRGFAHFFSSGYKPLWEKLHFYDTVWYMAFAGNRYRDEEPSAGSRVLTRRTLAALARPSARPKFIWVHYLDPHYPYNPSPAVLRARAPGLSRRAYREVRARGLRPDNAPRLHVIYEAEAQSTDLAVAPLLRELGRRENTLVIISADHGEEFAEHGNVSHGRTVYDEVARVPLIVALPRAGGAAAAGEISAPVSLVDLAPSVLRYLALAVPATMEGRPDLITARAAGPPRPVFVIRRSKGEFTAAAISGKRKLILHAAGGQERYEYFDLENDAGEQKPLPLDAAGERLRDALRERFGENPAAPPGRSAGTAPFRRHAELKALGYVE